MSPAATLPRLRPEPYPALPYGPFRPAPSTEKRGKIIKFPTLGQRVIRFIEKHCVFTNGRWIGKQFRLLPWEKQLILDLFELAWCQEHQKHCLRYRTALIGVAKKNGKTELVAAIALYFLLAHGEPAPHIVCAAASDEQADLVFGAASTMCSLSPTLREMVSVWEDVIVVPERPGAMMKRLAASGGRLDGKNVFIDINDELHEWLTPNQVKTYGLLRGALAAREHPLVINITTAGFDQESKCYELYEYGRKVENGEIEDRAFFFRWWQAPDDCDYKDLSLYPLSNPSYGETVKAEFFRDEWTKRPESEIRRYYLNQWVEAEEMWLPQGTWAACRSRKKFELEAGVDTFAGWDASTHNDSTAVVFGQWHIRKNGKRVLRVVAYIWERPKGPDGQPLEGWRLPIAMVEEILREAWRSKYKMRAIAYDPAFITWSAGELENEGLPMVKWPQTDSRMVPATKAAYELIVDRRLEHNGDPILSRHVRAAVAVQARQSGQRLSKGKRRKFIDAVIALLMMVAMAMEPPEEKEAEPFVVVV